MTTNTKEYMRKNYHDRRNKLIMSLGGHCQFPNCHNKKVELAHIKDTDIRGYGLSGWARILDIQIHPDCYKLLCKAHHEEFDHHKHITEEDKSLAVDRCYLCHTYRENGFYIGAYSP